MNRNISNSIIYNVYPTSFYDSNGDGIGDLKGITQKLDYIKQFADIVWVNPVYKSPFRDGGYDVQDYYQIDEKFGTMEDVEALTHEAHARGMKVLFDLVVGHTSDQHQWFLESQKAEPNEYSDYYVWNDDVFGWCPYKHMTGTCERNGNYLINFFSFQPSLNFGFAKKTQSWQHLYDEEPCCKLHDIVIDIIKFYMKKGIDGFRVDLANSIVKDDVDGEYSCRVWRKIFGKVREEYPEAIFVSEWGQPKFAVPKGTFDIDFITHCYFEGYNLLLRQEAGTNVLKNDGHSYFRKEGQGECNTFFDYFLENLAAVQGSGYISVVSGNHDLPRVSMGRTQEELKTVFAFLLALPTVPLIYYGDEIGMPYSNLKTKDGGYCRTGARTPMQWNDGKNAGFSQTDGETYLPIHENYTEVNSEAQAKDPKSLLNGVKDLVEAKRAYLGDFTPDAAFQLVQTGYPVVFTRKENGKTFFCAVNPSDRTYEIDVPANGKVLLSENVTLEGGKAQMGGVSYLWMLA
ncbi:MAG: hypothetical protein J6L76_06115 [Clostridia bacterium]|nr:hypothetical protein [Clostridia bacterium]